MAGPRRDTRGIVDAAGLLARVRFRRREPAPALRPYVEHYWLIDWDLDEPYTSRVVPHPSVNVVFQSFERSAQPPVEPSFGRSVEPPVEPSFERSAQPPVEPSFGRSAQPPADRATRPPAPGPAWSPAATESAEIAEIAEIAGISNRLFTQRLAGRGRVCGVQFRPGGFRPFSPARPVSYWKDRQAPLAEAMPVADRDITAVLGPEAEDERVAGLDAYLLGVLTTASCAATVPGAPGTSGAPGAGMRQAARAVRLVEMVRHDRSMRRVDRLAAAAGLSPRSLQRLFGGYVGVGPKWVILRYRVHEALERAESAGPAGAVDWAALATELGYSDQAHLVRDFTATVGVPPTAYARAGAA
ncbi:AraC family transcriptional regulator [Streptomyces tremellae]|uniref:HTH araC/xylS-type domain-containing protein n=1 Tax=Streptomyces tremellae TaxID=1124239 RepID=A0ABP7G1X9_9ACTN